MKVGDVLSTLGRFRGIHIFILIALVLLVSVVGAATTAQQMFATSPSKVLKHPDRFDRQPIELRGKLVNGRAWTSPQGNQYFRFHVSDGKTGVAVLATRRPSCADGQIVTVRGIFRRVKVIDSRTFYNYVEALTLGCREPPG